MKKSNFIVLVLVEILTTLQAQSQNTSSNPDQQVAKKEVVLKITGMTCAGCSSKVHKTLSDMTGIIDDDVAYPGDTFTITYDANKTDETSIIATIEKLGYKAKKTKS